jgi:pimeloyl-ACP methyl ester carboxylesterase
LLLNEKIGVKKSITDFLYLSIFNPFHLEENMNIAFPLFQKTLFSLTFLTTFFLFGLSSVSAEDVKNDSPQVAVQQSIEVKKVKVGEIEMAYYTRGNGKPLVMINGLKSTLSTWDPALLALLEKKYQLILFDNRGIGFSTDTTEDHTTIAQMADDTAGLIKALDLKQVSVLGWSMGARIGQQLAIRHPDLIEKLVLCAPNAGGTHQKAAAEEVTKSLTSTQRTPEQTMQLFFPSNAAGMAAGLAYQTRLNQDLTSGTIPNDVNVGFQTFERQTRARGSLWDNSDSNYDKLDSIKIPVLLTDGKEDIINPPENVQILASRIPFAWTAYFEGGHAFLYQDYQRFAELVILFLN